jgi:uncharacterized RDD family membrane protein YckC
MKTKLTIILLLFLTSCSLERRLEKYCPLCTQESKIEIVTEYRDTTITIPGETVTIVDSLYCDSLGNVVSKFRDILKDKNGKILSLETRLRNNVYYSNAKVDTIYKTIKGNTIYKKEIVYKKAASSERILSYFIDLSFIAALNSMIMVFIAWNVGMDLSELFFLYPDEMTPVVVTLFCGTYLIYFSVFEKTSSSTLGKSFLNLRVVTETQKNASWLTLLMRSCIGLSNFISLGLFSYFDLANKITKTKVVRAK